MSNWRDRAACLGHDPAMWYSPRGTYDSRDNARAREICGTCPVRDACLNDALEYEAGMPLVGRASIYGGLDPRQRAERDPLMKSSGEMFSIVATPSPNCVGGCERILVSKKEWQAIPIALRSHTTHALHHGMNKCGACYYRELRALTVEQKAERDSRRASGMAGEKCARCERILMPEKAWRRIQIKDRQYDTHAPHSGRGLCRSCRQVEGRPRVICPQRKPTKGTWDTWEELRRQGYTRKQAAERMGMTHKALEKAISRHEQRMGQSA